jgi:hypothetical protein
MQGGGCWKKERIYSYKAHAHLDLLVENVRRGRRVADHSLKPPNTCLSL